ncbi:SpoIIE family protein phosphatase [Kitasatospora paranensis]|uniref:SpoIIE family protein phosphatase n=1 Tax=Kitasatospora paranensis TaxID=258053 RepID=A0ABW2G823_9ACTN
MAEGTDRADGDGTDPERAVLEAAVARLRSEVEGLRTAMRSRAVIEQAKGLLVERFACTPDEAFEQLSARSQDANRKVAEIAAELLAAATPPAAPGKPGRAPTPAAGRDRGAARPPIPPRAPSPAPAAGSQAAAPPGGYAALRQLAAGVLARASGADDLARLLAGSALAPLGATAVVLALREPDGALRLVGSHGADARRLSQWRRIPPLRVLPLTEAVRSGTAVWVHDRAEFAARYPDLGGADLVPGQSVCALPLRVRGRVTGAMKLGWPEPYTPDPAAEAFLADLADLCADRLDRLARAAGASRPAVQPWFRAVVDTLLDPVLVLGAVHDADGRTVDLVVEHANTATVDLAGRTAADLAGRRLSELYPGMVAAGIFRHILDTATTGVPYTGASEQFTEVVEGAVRTSAMTLRAAPYPDGALLTWRAHDEQRRRESQLDQAQRLARLGTWGWEAGSARIGCSPEALRLLGLPGDDRTGATPGEALAAVAPADRAAVRDAAGRLFGGESPATIEFRAGRDGARHLRVLAEAEPGPAGEAPSAVHGVLQDVTRWRRAEQALAGTRNRLADQRRRTEAEHRAVEALQSALTSAPAGPLPTGLESAVRYLAAEREGRVGGDWYDVLPLPDGTVLVVAGDVSGHGLAAAARMAGLRYALRGLAYTGAEPGDLLGRLNRMLCHQHADHTATAVCGRLDPATGVLRWARAGHLPPLLSREGTARLLDPPEGLLLGAVPRAGYATAELRLHPGDVLLLYTDGLVVRRGADLGGRLARLRLAVDEYRAGDLDGCLDHVLRRMAAPSALDDTCLVGLRLRTPAGPGDGPIVENRAPARTGGPA